MSEGTSLRSIVKKGIITFGILVKLLARKSSLSEKTIKYAIAGVLALIVSKIGICIGNMPTYSEYFGNDPFLKRLGFETIYNYSFLIIPSSLLGLFGIIALIPSITYFTIRLIRRIWKLIKLIIYESIFEATKAIVDAKKKDHKRK